MESVLGIFASVDDPRDHTAQYELPALLFIALAATLCGAKSCVDIADFAEGNRAELAEIIDLPADGTPSHDTFSRLFRLLDPEQMEAALHRFGAAMREGLGLGAAEGIVAVDGKRLRRGYERGRASMPPLMVGVWDAETRLSIAARASPDGNEVAATLAALKAVSLKACTVTGDALHCHPEMARTVRARGGHYLRTLSFETERQSRPFAGRRGNRFRGGRGGGHVEREHDRGYRPRPRGKPARLRVRRAGGRAGFPRSGDVRPHRQRTNEDWRQDGEEDA